MRTLVIETSTTACSVALIDAGAVVASAHEVVGRGHAERLVPMIAELPDGGRADRILVDCGPGSFTGIRVGIAAARGLGFGWGAQVQGFSALPLIAVAAFAENPALSNLAVVLEGGHGEVFMATFDARPFGATAPFASLKPAAALEVLQGRAAFGNGVRWLTALDPDVPVHERLPVAADAIRLPPNHTALLPRPTYGRAPDATPPRTRVSG